MGFPSEKELARVRKKLEKVKGTIMLSEDATPREKFRWDLCQKFLLYKMKNKMTQKQLAEELGVDEAKVSKILRHQISEFSTDRLLNLLYLLDLQLNLRVG